MQDSSCSCASNHLTMALKTAPSSETPRSGCCITSQRSISVISGIWGSLSIRTSRFSVRISLHALWIYVLPVFRAKHQISAIFSSVILQSGRQLFSDAETHLSRINRHNSLTKTSISRRVEASNRSSMLSEFIVISPVYMHIITISRTLKRLDKDKIRNTPALWSAEHVPVPQVHLSCSKGLSWKQDFDTPGLPNGPQFQCH